MMLTMHYTAKPCTHFSVEFSGAKFTRFSRVQTRVILVLGLPPFASPSSRVVEVCHDLSFRRVGRCIYGTSKTACVKWRVTVHVWNQCREDKRSLRHSPLAPIPTILRALSLSP